MTYIEAFILAVIEGLTEFLPISSTGHMVIAEAFLHPADLEFTKLFTVTIQLGAILSVVVLYYKRFLQSIEIYKKLIVAVIPVLILGFLLNKKIDSLLENAVCVAVTLTLGGIVLVMTDKWFKHVPEEGEKPFSIFNAIRIGLFQCIALIPGVSRSAATIIGGMTQGLSRKQAAEFSFLLAVPTMLAATGFKLLKNHDQINSQNVSILLFGNVVAFIVAMFAIKGFISILTRYGFKWFGYYRILVGLILLGLYFSGFSLAI